MNEASRVLIEVPQAQGVDIYLFAGPSLRNAIQRYNLFSGGGALPPRWGLGFWYRCYEDYDQAQVLAMAAELRDRKIPCDVLGLEPHWQTHYYSCSFVWSDKFPDPNKMIGELSKSGYRLNLWEHAFTHPTSPLHQPLLPYSGDYEVWRGLVPDFAGEKARALFGDYHERTFVAHGVAGFKLDECDNSDYTGHWSFPELSRFPSGIDGELMHCFFGLRYQDTIQSIYERRKIRTLGLVRSSHALASPYPYVLYSDLYDHQQFIRAVANAGFTGLLWCPEVRDAKDSEDLLRRLQTVVFSPLAMVNAWYIKNPPWKQVDREANNAGEFHAGWETLEAQCRNLIETRMRLVPYLYSAFVRYRLKGVPPFRALVVDYPNDPHAWTVDDQYLAGESLLVAPVIAGEAKRGVYLPAGKWFDFWTGKAVEGGKTIEVSVSLSTIPVFVKEGTLLPLAQPTLHTADPDSFKLTVRGYGSGDLACILHEDDGSPDPVFTEVNLNWPATAETGTLHRSRVATQPAYMADRWERISGV
jgi:alpha-D-xyloside xylohydrolase